MTEKRKILTDRRKRTLLLFLWGFLLWVVSLSTIGFAIFAVICFFFWDVGIAYALAPFVGYLFRLIVVLALVLTYLERHRY